VADQVEDIWALAVPLEELWEGKMLGLRLAGIEVLLLNLGNQEIHAYENRCPHASAPLSEGYLSATTLRCASHHWEFDVRSGAALSPRSCQLRRFPIKIVDGAVLVRVAGR
jgi:toluene monooxygenase system ferredoxin subunit